MQHALLKQAWVPVAHGADIVPPHPLGRPLSLQLAGGVGVQLHVPAIVELDMVQVLFWNGEAWEQAQVRF